MAAVQQEIPVGAGLDDVGQRHAAFDVAAAGIGGVALVFEPHRVQRVPGRAVERAAAGQRGRFGGAVDFVHRRAAARFCAAREIGAERRGGREHQVQRRHRQLRGQQGRKVERRGHQHARARQGLQRGHDVLRVEGLGGRELATAVQGDQEGGLEAVAVLRGHGADDGQRPLQQAQRRGFGAAVQHQLAPGLAVRLRQAGGARGEQDGHEAFVVDQRHLVHVGARQRGGLGEQGAGQAGHVHRLFAEPGGAGVVGREALQRLGRLRRGLQADLASEQAGDKAHGEVVAVVAHVEQPAARGQQGGERLRVGEELTHPHRALRAPGQHVVQAAATDQR